MQQLWSSASHSVTSASPAACSDTDADTVKTRMQARSASLSSIRCATELFKREGLVGFYRGGTPLLLGGGLMRAAQFGVFENSLAAIQAAQGGASQYKVGGLIDPQVALAVRGLR